MFSAAEVAAHNGPDDCWVVIRGVVYDVTSFLMSHPGGAMVFSHVAGRDATVPFELVGHSHVALKQLKDMRIGVLAAEPTNQAVGTTGGPRLRTATGGLIGLAASVAIPCVTCGAALPESADLCGSCQQLPSPRAPRKQLQLAGKTIQTGEEIHAVMVEAPSPLAAAAARSGSERQQQQSQPVVDPSRATDWQTACLCGREALRREPAKVLAEAKKQGDVKARMGEWSEALSFYHQAIAALSKSTAAETFSSVHAAASIASRRLGSMRSALRHADLGVAACGTAAYAHAARGAALEALGLVADAHVAFVEAARLEPTCATYAAAAARLLPLRALFANLEAADAEGGRAAAVQKITSRISDDLWRAAAVWSTPLSDGQRQLVERLWCIVAEMKLAPQLLPVPTASQVLGPRQRAPSSKRFDSSPHRRRQQRLMALLAVDAAVEAARASHGGHNACAGVHEWLLRKASELGLEIRAELVRAAQEEEEECDGVEESASEEEQAEEATVASEEVALPAGGGRALIQFELDARRQRLTFSLVSLEGADFGEASLRYTFAMGLASAYLIEAESEQHPYMQFAEWCSEQRGDLSPPEGLPPALSVERSARAFVGFFLGKGGGGRPPIGPREMPPTSSFTCAVTHDS